MLGVAGLDETIRLTQAQVGLGLSDRRPDLSNGSRRLGDRAANTIWQHGFWFADFSYVTTQTGTWRKGREAVLGKGQRRIPTYLDSSFRRFTQTAPQWAQQFEAYLAAIERVQPDGFAAWDYPDDRAKTVAYLRRLEAVYPDPDKLWPVFSVRWAWQDNAHLSYARLPGWASRKLAGLIPFTHTQQAVKEATAEKWARAAIANALLLAKDPDFLAMVDRYGKVMLGGMVRGPIPRPARHLYAATLCHLFPGVKFWLLGQANSAVMNGLGLLGLLDSVWTDGSWWLLEASHERISYVEDGLITTYSFEAKKGKDGKREVNRQTFFSLQELQAAHLRSLFAAKQGLVNWPGSLNLPTDLIDAAARAGLKANYQAAQMELALDSVALPQATGRAL